MTSLTRPRLDPLIDAPLVGPRVLSLVGRWAVPCNLWRVWQPAHALARRGYPVEWRWVADPAAVQAMPHADALVLCRVAWERRHQASAERLFARARAAGQRLVYECDDDLLSPLAADHQRRGMQRHRSRRDLEAENACGRWTVERCDGVTVSTQYLASTVRRFTSAPVEVVPNAIDVEWFRGVQAQGRRTVPGPTIGWAGGMRPDRELAEMAEAWGRIARRYPAVRFVVLGHHPRPVVRHVPADRLHCLEWLDLDVYPQGLLNIDIGCCPLEPIAFNFCKSPIKAWEYALSGAAVVASPTVYGQTISDRENGFLATTVDEWEGCLSHLIEKEEERRYAAAALKREVLDRWSLERNVWRWPAAWNRLMGGTG